MEHETLAWLLLGLLTLAGVAGVFLPFLPGPPLILAAAVVHKLMLPEVLSWWTVGFLGCLLAMDCLAVAGGSVVGARMAGASRWGLLGAGTGALAGIPFGLPGLLIGALLGAALAEMAVAKREAPEAWKAAVGAAVGIALSGVARLAIALFMVALLLVDAFLW